MNKKAASLLLGILSISILVSGCLSSEDKQSYQTGFIKSANGYIYSPKGSLFSIEFPGKPTLENTKRESNPHNISMEVADYSVMEDSTHLKVNFELYDASFNTSIKDVLTKMIQREAILKDLPNAEVISQDNEFGLMFTIRGSKIVSGVNTLFEDHWYFKETNLFSVQIVCPKDKYPTHSAQTFFKSLKLLQK